MPDGKRRAAKERGVSASASVSSSSSARAGDDAAAWLTYTAPDGRPYYYNSITKESRWKPPKALRTGDTAETSDKKKKKKKRPPSSRHIAPVTTAAALDEDASPAAEHDLPEEKEGESRRRSERRRSGSARSRVGSGDKDAAGGDKRGAFRKLQASLEGRLNVIKTPMAMGGPPPMLRIDRSAEVHSEAAVSTAEPSVEEQYEAETAGMSAAERLRFLRRKRQEAMLQKQQSVAQDDFLAEFANNMKKKELVHGGSPSRKQQQWKEQEAAEEERKRKQMMDEAEAKLREEKEQAERERRREEERREQEEQELERKEARRVEKEQRQQERREKEAQEETKRQAEEEKRHQEEVERLEGKPKKEPTKRSKQRSRREEGGDQIAVDEKPAAVIAAGESNGRVLEQDGESRRRSDSKQRHHRDSKGSSKTVEAAADPPLNGEVKVPARAERRSRARLGSSARSIPVSLVEDAAEASEEISSRSTEAEHSGHQGEGDKVRIKKPKSKDRSKDGHDANPQAGTASTDVPATQEEDEEEVRAREKRERREKRRLAKLEAARKLEEPSSHTPSEPANGPPTDSSGVNQTPSSNESQHSQAPSSGRSQHNHDLHEHHHHHPSPGEHGAGVCPYCHPYPYMMPPPPPLPPYGYYYPYMQPPPFSGYPPYAAVPPGFLGYPPQPAFAQPPMAGVPPMQAATLAGASAAMIPYNGDPRYSVAAPTLDRCEGCHGIGVALVEKNGFCAHCNRLRLEFIVASARMRQRCSVCNGWGYQLVDPSTGMCNHCSRLKQSSKAPIGGVPALPTAVAASAMTQATTTATGDPSLGDIEWDESDSDDDSDWDD